MPNVLGFSLFCGMIQKSTYFCVRFIKRQLTQTHKSQISTAIKKVMVRRPHNAKLKELRLFLLPLFSPLLYCLLNSICSVKMLNSLRWLSLLVSLFIHSFNKSRIDRQPRLAYILYIYVFFMSLSEALQFSKMPHSLLNCFQYSTILCTINYFVITFYLCVCVCVWSSLFPFRIIVWTAFIAMANIMSTHNCVVILCFIFNLIMASYKE